MLNGHPHSQVILPNIEISPSKNTSRFSNCNGRNPITSKRKRKFYKYQWMLLGLSPGSFSPLRTKLSKAATAAGTPPACTCTAHQNENSMLSAAKLDKIYHKLIVMIVCSHRNKACMIQLSVTKDICQQSLIQNEIQGYYWCKHQCTLHLLVIYYKESI